MFFSIVTSHWMPRQSRQVVKVLIALGANPTDTNHAGMNAAGYAVWARNRRLATALGVPEDAEPCPGLARLQELAGPDRAALFLGPPPAGYQRCTQSGIGQRMEGFINCPATAGAPTTPPSFAAIKGGAGALAVIREEGLSELEAQVWSARLRAIDGVARGEKRLGSHEAVALALWTNNGALHNKINTAILAQQLSPTYERFAGCLCSALRALPVYQGEVFVGSSTVDRKLYTVGTEFTWPHFASASTLWKVSLCLCYGGARMVPTEHTPCNRLRSKMPRASHPKRERASSLRSSPPRENWSAQQASLFRMPK